MPHLVGQSQSSLALEPGHWRSSNSSVNVYMCAYHEACITNTNTSALFGDQLCAHGYTGPLCGTCVRGFFFSWTTQRCTACAAPSAHADTLKLWLVLFCIAAVVCAGFASLYAYAYYRGGPVLQNWLERATIAMHSEKLTISVPTKGYIILITCQTIFQFNDITTAVDREAEYPEPARGFINSLSFSFFDIALYIPPSCVQHGANFYDKLLWATVLPIILVCFIVFVFLVQILYDRARHGAIKDRQTIRRLWASHVNVIMVLLYLILPSVSTIIFNTFVCQQIDGKLHLSSQLTLTCESIGTDGVPGPELHERFRYELYAYGAMAAYPIFVPMLWLWLLFVNRSHSPRATTACFALTLIAARPHTGNASRRNETRSGKRSTFEPRTINLTRFDSSSRCTSLTAGGSVSLRSSSGSCKRMHSSFSATARGPSLQSSPP